jgi:hypothetical protein
MTDIHTHQRRRDPRGGHRAGRSRPARPRAWSLSRVTWAVRVLAAVTGLVLALVVASATAAWAQPTPVPPDAPLEPGVTDLTTVVNNIRIWLIGILFAVATLYATIGGFRYMWSNGDPGEVEKAKSAFRNAAIGYGLAVLAPLVVTIVTSFLL